MTEPRPVENEFETEDEKEQKLRHERAVDLAGFLKNLDETKDAKVVQRPARFATHVEVVEDTVRWELKNGEAYLLRLRSA